MIEISTNVNFLIQRWELDWLMKHNEEIIIEENHLNQFLLSVINSKFYFLFLKQNTFSVLCSLQNDDDMKSNNVEHLWRISIISEIDWEIKGKRKPSLKQPGEIKLTKNQQLSYVFN